MSDKAVLYLFSFLSLFPAFLCYFSIKEVQKIKCQRVQLEENGIESHATIASLEKDMALDFTPTNFGSPIRKTEYMMRCTYFNSDKPIQFNISFTEAFEAAQRGKKYVSETESRGLSTYEVVYFSLTEKEYKTFYEGQEIPIKYIYGQPDSATRIDKDGNFRSSNIGWTIYLWGFLFVACLVLAFFYGKGIRV